ncbi:hypothetical protein PHEL85_1289 [Polaribacter sp. Hel1_85]|nr:hypothetical protein PHEL85_1289 [Polaribacter sp. Hel1_85]
MTAARGIGSITGITASQVLDQEIVSLEEVNDFFVELY